MLLGLKDDEIIACALIEKVGTASHIGMLAVQPELQAVGAGKSMLAQAECYAIDNFDAEILRMTVVSVRSELLAFYQRRGYRRMGTSTSYPNDSGVGNPRCNDLKIEILEKSVSTPCDGRSD
jgi:ribosomal protein S18 acetylase RimI-like enzyme